MENGCACSARLAAPHRRGRPDERNPLSIFPPASAPPGRRQDMPANEAAIVAHPRNPPVRSDLAARAGEPVVSSVADRLSKAAHARSEAGSGAFVGDVGKAPDLPALASLRIFSFSRKWCRKCLKKPGLRPDIARRSDGPMRPGAWPGSRRRCAFARKWRRKSLETLNSRSGLAEVRALRTKGRAPALAVKRDPPARK